MNVVLLIPATELIAIWPENLVQIFLALPIYDLNALD